MINITKWHLFKYLLTTLWCSARIQHQSPAPQDFIMWAIFPFLDLVKVTVGATSIVNKM